MNKRKTGKEYRKEYRDLLDNTVALRNRIIKRANELIEQYPDVHFHYFNFRDYTVSEFNKSYKIDVDNAISMIEKIEAHIETLQPYKQTKINWNIVPDEKSNE